MKKNPKSGQVRYTRQAFKDSKTKTWKVFYEGKNGRIIIEDEFWTKSGAESLLIDKNRYKSELTWNAPTVKQSKLIESSVKNRKQVQTAVDRLLKKPDEKIKPKDKELLDLYSGSPYRKKELEKKIKAVTTRKEKTARKEKEEKQKLVKGLFIIRSIKVTYAKTSRAFFYFQDNAEQKSLEYIDPKTGRTRYKKQYAPQYHKYIQNILDGFNRENNFQRVRITYSTENLNISIDTDTPHTVEELERAMADALAMGDVVGWTQEKCVLKMEGLL